MVIATPAPNLIGEKRVTFHRLDWQAYQQILQALPLSRSARLTYDRRQFNCKSVEPISMLAIATPKNITMEGVLRGQIQNSGVLQNGSTYQH